MNLDDLYHKAYQGDQAAEAQLLQTLAVMFRMFVRRRGVGNEDVEDIVQSALTKTAMSYRRDQMKTNFAAWAQTVVKSQFIDFYRSDSSRKRRQVVWSAVDETSSQPEHDPTLIRRLKECLKELHAANSLHARLVNLHYLGYTTSEVCEQLRITANNRRVALCRARAMLSACLKRRDRHHE